LTNAAALFLPNIESTKCQGCASSTIDTNNRLLTLKNPAMKTKTFRPLYFCTIQCMLKYIKTHHSTAKWGKLVENIMKFEVERASLPAVRKVQSA